MKLRISRQELQKRSLFIATPVYGGQPFGLYSASIDRLKLTMQREELRWDDRQVFNESLVPRARNYLVKEFLKTDLSHLVFIDADIEFREEHVLLMLAWADPASNKDVICGAYPKKHICWEKVRDAAKAGVGDDDPAELAKVAGEFFFTALEPDAPSDWDEPVQLKESGTGFMMVQRRVFERIAAAHSELRYEDSWTGETMTDFFPVGVVGRRYESEDFGFCRLARGVGMKLWLLPRINLGHVGFHKYLGNIEALAAAIAVRGNRREA